MKRLTAEQQAQVVKLMPVAGKIAKRFNSHDDLYESVAMEALCEAVLSYDPSRNDDIKKWVSQVVKSRLIDYQRLEQSRQHPRAVGDAPAKAGGVSVYELIERLSDGVRDVMRARHVERMSVKQVAGYYELPQADVEDRLRRGAEELRRLIDDQPPNAG